MAKFREKIKALIFTAGMMLFILSAVLGALSVGYLSDMLPAEEYQDRGVHTFVPYEVYPVSVKNTGASGRDRRMNPTKTVYKVYYFDRAGEGYQWSVEVLSREQGQALIDAVETVDRRVLGIPSSGTYITVDPWESAESYTAGLKRKYVVILGASGVYLFFYIIAMGIWYYRRQDV